MHTVPPDLFSEDGVEARAAELQKRISREWFRYALIEGLLIGVPFLVVTGVQAATDAFSKTTFLVLAGVAAAIWIAFSLYWIYARIQPLRRELESLERTAAL